MMGGPCAGVISPGLNVAGQLRADASNGDTGVFVNGRQLYRQDVAVLSRLGPLSRGRYWVDGQGNWGLERGPMLGNLRVAAAQVAGGNNNGSWRRRSWTTDSSIGGDGNTFYYIDKNSSYISSH